MDIYKQSIKKMNKKVFNKQEIEHAKKLQCLFNTLGFNYSIKDLLSQPRVNKVTMYCR